MIDGRYLDVDQLDDDVRADPRRVERTDPDAGWPVTDPMRDGHDRVDAHPSAWPAVTGSRSATGTDWCAAGLAAEARPTRERIRLRDAWALAAVGGGSGTHRELDEFRADGSDGASGSHDHRCVAWASGCPALLVRRPAAASSAVRTVWSTDITEPTGKGKLYVCAVTDACAQTGSTRPGQFTR